MTEQFVIVATTDRELVYDSCYGRDEAKEAAKRCSERYGVKSNPRAFSAAGYMREHPLKTR